MTILTPECQYGPSAEEASKLVEKLAGSGSVLKRLTLNYELGYLETDALVLKYFGTEELINAISNITVEQEIEINLRFRGVKPLMFTCFCRFVFRIATKKGWDTMEDEKALELVTLTQDRLRFLLKPKVSSFASKSVRHPQEETRNTHTHSQLDGEWFEHMG